MGANQSVIVQGEDIQTKYPAIEKDLSSICRTDLICPPGKFINRFTNYDRNIKFKYLILYSIILFFIISILLLKYI